MMLSSVPVSTGPSTSHGELGVTQTSQRYRPIVLEFCRRKHTTEQAAIAQADHLLTKYQGYEEQLVALLRERYGALPGGAGNSEPEENSSPLRPATAAGLHNSSSRNESPHTLARSLGAKYGFRGQASRLSSGPLRALRSEYDTVSNAIHLVQQMRFQSDREDVARGRIQMNAAVVVSSLAKLGDLVDSQDLEILRLREELEAQRREVAAVDDMSAAANRELAAQVTKLQLSQLTQQRNIPPGQAPAEALAEAETQRSTLRAQLSEEQCLLGIYSRVLRHHFALYPNSPLRGKLLDIDVRLLTRVSNS